MQLDRKPDAPPDADWDTADSQLQELFTMSKSAQAQAMPEFQFVQPTVTVLQHPRNNAAPVSESANPTGATAATAEAVVYPISIGTAAAMLTNELGFTCNPNTLKSRWLPDKITPAYEGVNCPPLRSSDGKITEFGYQAIRDYIAACIVGKNGMKIASEAFREQLEQRFGIVAKPADTTDQINNLRTAFQQQRQESEQRTFALVKVGKSAEDQLRALQAAEADLDAAIAAELAEQEAEEEAQRLQQSIEIKAAALEQIRRDRAMQAEIKRLRGLGKSPAAPPPAAGS